MGDEDSEIVEIVKIPRGFVVRFANGELRLWVDDSEEVSFIKVGPIALTLEKNHAIQGIRLSNNT